jgi:hypothetical protein
VEHSAISRTQFANGPIPYNVIDTKGLRNKLQLLPDRDDPLTNRLMDSKEAWREDM